MNFYLSLVAVNRRQPVFRRSFQLLFGLVLWAAQDGYAQFDVNTIPSPKDTGQEYYVSNPSGILSQTTVDSLNRLAHIVDSLTSSELAVVVVDDFAGDDDFQFALDLFNAWRIGKAGSDNGLLLFVGTEKRAYRFITGYGMETVLPDALLKRIGETLLVPKFRAGDYDGGVLAAMDAVQTVVLNPSTAGDLRRNLARKNSFFYRHQIPLLSFALAFMLYGLLWRITSRAFNRIPTRSGRKPARTPTGLYLVFGGVALFLFGFFSIFLIVFVGMPPWWLYRWSYLPLYVAVFFGLGITALYFKGLSLIQKTYVDAANRLEAMANFNKRMLLPILATPLCWLLLYLATRWGKGDQLRLVPPQGGGWQRIDRDKQKDVSRYLDRGQRKEESVGALVYEIWTREGPGGIHPVAFPGKNFSKYGLCPSCGYHTFSNTFLKVVKRPTVIDEGEGERLQECSNCKHSVSHGRVVLSRTKPIRSSSGGSRSSSSSSSPGSSGSGSSNSGSWGGGRSGGGGAGGRW
ncbi:TPM domain-containing protein [Parapedobacter defluvii]|uniref:TPM domain-containing protein n=1 Tax=Parapedobacter defluvii TaxID=2045106 RepID=UPI001668016A|nr:TPM domain-containing protein [Parapedobacter defluvii]